MNRVDLVLRVLTGELARELERVGVAPAEDVGLGWVVRTPGQGRGKRWWIQTIEGPTGPYGLMTLGVRLVEVHGVRSRSRMRELGHDPDTTEKLTLRGRELLVVDYRDWSEDANTD